MLLGITGCPGSGKSVLAKSIADSGWELIDVDSLARDVVDNEKGIRERLAEVFGEDILLSDGSLDRRLLAKRAFAKPETTERLNSIVHPPLINKLISSIAAHDKDGKNCVVDCALIFEWGIETLFGIIICVYADKNVRKQRLMERDGRSEKDIEDLFSAQIPEIDKIKRSNVAVANNNSVLVLKTMGELIAELPDRLDGNE